MNGELKKIEDELIDGFILREYTDRYGVMDTNFKEKAIEKYRNDAVFNYRVKSVVSAVMGIITRNIGS